MKLTDDPSIRFVIQTDGQVAGPYTFEGLESLVYLGRITPDTPVSRADEDAFLPIRETVLSEILFPRLRENSGPDKRTPPDQPVGPDETHRKHYGLAEAKFEKVNAGKTGKIDVLDILDDIRQQEIASGRDLNFRTRFRISKRSIDFWIMLIAGNVVIIGGGIAMQNTSSIVFGFAGSGLYTFGLLWSMYGVMDRY